MHTYNGLRLNLGPVDWRRGGGSQTPLRAATGIRTRAQLTNAILYARVYTSACLKILAVNSAGGDKIKKSSVSQLNGRG